MDEKRGLKKLKKVLATEFNILSVVCLKKLNLYG